jgi:hypothetical protein
MPEQEAIRKTLEELRTQANELSRKMAFLRTARTKLALGWAPTVVMAELHAAGIYDEHLWNTVGRRER